MKRILGLLAVICLALAGCNNDENTTGPAQPTISGVTPNVVSIGQIDGVFRILGTNFSGVTSVQMGDGISVTSSSALSASEIEVHINVSGTAAPGARTVIVSAAGGTASSAAVFSVSSNHVPLAKFKVDPPAGSLATIFTFDASSSTDTSAAQSVASYRWDFGNGQSAKGVKVTKKFPAIGRFNVILTVTDHAGGTDIASKMIEVSKNSPPIPRFTVTPSGGGTNTTFEFDASASSDPDGRITGYSWDFGDNKKATGVKTDHQYGSPGTFKVTLTVTDNSNQKTTSDEKDIKVEKGPQETACSGNGGGHQTIIKGKVVAVEAGQWAIVDFGGGHNCNNTWHKCDDFRKLNPEGFYGIVDKMTDRGNGVMGVHNSCPYRWPPSVGEQVFIYYKTCQQNHCP